MSLQTHTDCIDFLNLVRLHPDSILIADNENKIIFANTSGLRLLCRLPSWIPTDTASSGQVGPTL